MTNIISTADMTVEDVLAIGPDAVNDRLPQRLLIQMARRYVIHEMDQRERRAALARERRALKQADRGAGTGLDAIILSASLQAAQAATMQWLPLLPVEFKIPAKGIETTWGEAVVDEHLQRAQWLENQSVGNLRTAVQHRRAIYDLEDKGFDTLQHLVEATAR